MIKTTCKICGYDKEFGDKYAGKTFKCPNCTSPVKIEINQILSESKIINEDITNFPIQTPKIKIVINKITYIILGSFIFAFLLLFIFLIKHILQFLKIISILKVLMLIVKKKI